MLMLHNVLIPEATDTILNPFVTVSTIRATIWKWKQHNLTINQPYLSDPLKISDKGIKIIVKQFSKTPGN